MASVSVIYPNTSTTSLHLTLYVRPTYSKFVSSDYQTLQYLQHDVKHYTFVMKHFVLKLSTNLKHVMFNVRQQAHNVSKENVTLI